VIEAEAGVTQRTHGPRGDALIAPLYRFVERGKLTVPVIGVARSGWSVNGAVREVDPSVLRQLQEQNSLITGDYVDPATFEHLAKTVHEQVGPDAFCVHCLAAPPGLFGTVADELAAVGLHQCSRLAVEKPFGRDLAFARELDTLLRHHFADERIFRVDHYLGREPVEPRPPVRQHPARTDLEPHLGRPHRDHAGRDPRRRRARLVLRRRLDQQPTAANADMLHPQQHLRSVERPSTPTESST
jgi:Glucose-6-phosphate dehydrogenase, NAD binding domain